MCSLPLLTMLRKHGSYKKFRVFLPMKRQPSLPGSVPVATACVKNWLMCCGKTTLLKQIPDCVDLDDELWPQLTKEEAEFISQTPWTKEIGDFIDKLVYEKISVKVGHPLFTTIIVDCDVVIYLDISDELLAEHCKKRGNDFSDSKNVKNSIEEDWNNHRKKGGKAFYYLTITE